MKSLKVNEFSMRRSSPRTYRPEIRSYEAFLAELEQWQGMARHRQYHFSLLLFKMQSVMTDRGQTKKFIRTLIDRIRSTDTAGWIGDDHLGIILPDTPVSGAACLAEDIQDLTGEMIASLHYTVYSFPADPLVYSEVTPNQCASGYIAIHYTEMVTETSPTDWFQPTLPGTDSSQQYISYNISQIPVPEGVRRNRNKSLERYPMPIWKRTMDVLVSMLGLIGLSPLFLIVALVIKAVSKGPVFFKQKRVGCRGKIFRMWKFRTYEVDADTRQHQHYMSSLIGAAQQGENGSSPSMTKLDNAPGIIPFGNLIRKTCIDELPQLINVFLGEMSLIGPRPPVVYEAEQYADWHRERLDAVPGMTGLWQVSGKNRLSFNEMVRLDIRYSKIKSLGLDVLILLKTPLAIASQIRDALLTTKPGVVVEIGSPDRS